MNTDFFLYSKISYNRLYSSIEENVLYKFLKNLFSFTNTCTLNQPPCTFNYNIRKKKSLSIEFESSQYFDDIS